MRGLVWFVGIGLIFVMAPFGVVAEQDYPVTPVDFSRVRLEGGFWGARQAVNRGTTLAHNFDQCDLTGRTDLFAFAAGRKQGVHSGYCFNDTDIYKSIEAASFALTLQRDPALEARVDALIRLVAAAQQPDGYLYTAKQAFNPDKPAPGGKERWADIRWSHELYCAGHLYEAAVAHHRATGKRTLLEVALRNADLVCATFGPGKREEPPGHQEVEIGLVKLHRLTGERKYLDMAKYFLDIRGVSTNGRELGGEYNQDHKPVREQDEVVGHAVRASYMYAGMADVAALTGDATLVAALDKLWRNATHGKLYITGGFGATGSGEAFAGNFELPNMSAYCETCSSIAGIYWNHRMFLLHGDAKYLDVLERTLYNAFLAGVSMEGDGFFYPNPLESVGQHTRSPWFGCACCPPNVARLIASLGEYYYAIGGDRLMVNLYGAGTAEIAIAGRTIKLRQETDYPWSGTIRLVIEPESEVDFELAVRIPSWALGRPVDSDIYRYTNLESAPVELRVNGTVVPVHLDKGFAVVARSWHVGDTVELVLPMPVRRVRAHEKVTADLGRVALERGPVVYCIEWPDVSGGHVRNLLLDDSADLSTRFIPDLLNGVQVIEGTAIAHEFRDFGARIVREERPFRAIPYYAWAHRGPGEMQAWLAREEHAVHPLNEPTIASTSRVSVSSGRQPTALNDQVEPASSADETCPAWYWWPNKGTTEWAQYNFPEAREVSITEVYWYDEGAEGECRVPASWRILYRDGEKWTPVYSVDPYGVEPDRYNRVIFETVKTTALRLEIVSRPDVAGGILEWKVK